MAKLLKVYSTVKRQKYDTSIDRRHYWVLIVQLVMVGGVIWIVVQGLNSSARKRYQNSPRYRQREICKGEISKEEREELKRNLK
jgi:hypothetical protein